MVAVSSSHLEKEIFKQSDDFSYVPSTMYPFCILFKSVSDRYRSRADNGPI